MKQSPAASDREKILVVNPDPQGLRNTCQLLESADFLVEGETSCNGAIQRLENGETAGLILLEVAEHEEALKAIQLCRRIRADQKVVVFSEISDVSVVVQAVRLGALDYIAKPLDEQGLIATLRRSLDSRQAETSAASGNTVAREHIETVEHDIFFLAASPAMQKIRSQVEQVAKVDIPVLLLGESGAGKEVLARLVHKLSRRAGKPLIKVNCAALPRDLLESELFGFEAGAFTGATRSKPGMLELCDKGTIFLDEIGEMSPALQAKLLHVLQDGKFTRLGGRTTVTSNFRVIAATNIDVHQAMNSKTFREDLYYRLNAFTINIPPLRERREEIPLLLKHFMQQFSDKYDCAAAECSHAMVRACMRHNWPGNLRELGNFVKRYMVLQDEALAIAELEEKDISAEVAPNLEDEALMHGGAGLKSMVQNLKERAEPRIIERVLVSTKWNCKMAAMQLQISYKALLYKMKQYRIFPPGVSGPGLRNAHG